jgi:aspartate kinase
MSRLVMKFGGTSVADLERIRRVARLVNAEVAAGHKVAVVVSAMAGKTNELVAWTDGSGAAAQGLDPSDDEYDVVVAGRSRSSRTTPMAAPASTTWSRTS